MLKEQEIIEKLKESVAEILDSSGFVKVTEVQSNPLEYGLLNDNKFIDLCLQVETKKKDKYLILFEVKSTGQPRYARMAASQLQSFLRNKENVYGVFGASYISEDSMEICRQMGVGFVDLAGNCLFNFGNVYINISGKPNPYPATKQLKSIFAPKSTRALRVILCNPKKDWLVQDLAKEANISIAQASYLKQRLLEYEFVEETGVIVKKGKQFRLTNPETLLKKWAENYTYRENKMINYYSLDEVKEIEKKLLDYCESNKIRYAFTLTSGASLVAPFLRYKRIFAYISDSIEKVALALGWKEVPSGPNITILEPYDEGIFYGLQEINGMKVVSDVQLYLDLKGYKERGEEAAQFLLENRLRKQW